MDEQPTRSTGASVTAILEVSGVQWASQGWRSVTFDPSRTSIVELRDWIRDCGYHCAGRSVPEHVCDPLAMSSHSTVRPDFPSTPDVHGARDHGASDGGAMDHEEP